MAENVVEILVKSRDKTKAGFVAAETAAEESGSRVQAIWAKHSDAINTKLATIGSGVAKGGGILAIGSAALAAAGPLGALTLAVAAFGAVAAPELKKGSKGADELKASFGSLQKSMAPMVDKVIALGAGLLKDLMPALGTLAKAGGQVLTSFFKPLDAFIQSKVFAQLISQFAQFAVQAGKLTGPVLTQLLKLLLQLFVNVMPAGMQILKVLLPLFVQLVADLVPVITVVANVTAKILNWLVQTRLLKPILLGLVPVIMLLIGSTGIGAVTIAVALLVAGIVELSKNWRKIWADIKQWGQDAWNFLTHGWGQLLIPGLLIIRKEVEFVRDHWRDAWNAIRAVGAAFMSWYRGSLIAQIVSGVTNIVNHFTTLRHDISSIFAQIRGDIASAWNTIWNNTVTRVSNGIGSVVSWVRGLPGKITGAVGNAGKVLTSWGSEVMNGLLNGFKSILTTVANFFKGIPGNILKWLGIHSPPQWAIEAGKHIMNGIGIGMDKARTRVEQATEAIQAATQSGLSFPGSGLISLGARALGFGGGGGGVERWRSTVLKALAMEHLPASLANQVLRQISTESGGNPNAQNNSDINAQRGDPSRGLLQTIGSTFRAYHWPGTSGNIFDPLANIAAAINYARHAYGPNLMSGGMGLGSGHGYAAGGPASGLSWVGEHGKELLRLPAGSHVYSNADSMAMGAGGAQVVQLQIAPASQSAVEQFLLLLIRNLVRVKGGGNVQKAFGR